jgi:gas vesicle protein
MRRGVLTNGLLDFEVATTVGALTGGIVGAVIGLAVGHRWETTHRRARARADQTSANA